ncbi:MAG: hypothetical protein J6C42_03205, partial [Clostridia bacterium]|nr:hypothetical protein [Clostridia bacterium]
MQGFCGNYAKNPLDRQGGEWYTLEKANLSRNVRKMNDYASLFEGGGGDQQTFPLDEQNSPTEGVLHEYSVLSV